MWCGYLVVFWFLDANSALLSSCIACYINKLTYFPSPFDSLIELIIICLPTNVRQFNDLTMKTNFGIIVVMWWCFGCLVGYCCIFIVLQTGGGIYTHLIFPTGDQERSRVRLGCGGMTFAPDLGSAVSWKQWHPGRPLELQCTKSPQNTKDTFDNFTFRRGIHSNCPNNLITWHHPPVQIENTIQPTGSDYWIHTEFNSTCNTLRFS